MRTVGGVVTALARKYTKRGDLMATFVLEDLGGAVEVMVFPKTMASYGELLTEDAIVCVKARIDMREDAAEAHRDGDHPAAARDRRRPAGAHPDPARRAQRPEGRAAEGGAAASTPATARCYVYIEGAEKTTVVSLGDEHLVDGPQRALRRAAASCSAPTASSPPAAARSARADDQAGSRRRARPGRAGRDGARPRRRTRGRRRAARCGRSTSVLVEQRAARDAGAHDRVEVRLGSGPVGGEEAVDWQSAGTGTGSTRMPPSASSSSANVGPDELLVGQRLGQVLVGEPEEALDRRDPT